MAVTMTTMAPRPTGSMLALRTWVIAAWVGTGTVAPCRRLRGVQRHLHSTQPTPPVAPPRTSRRQAESQLVHGTRAGRARAGGTHGRRRRRKKRDRACIRASERASERAGSTCSFHAPSIHPSEQTSEQRDLTWSLGARSLSVLRKKEDGGGQAAFGCIGGDARAEQSPSLPPSVPLPPQKRQGTRME